MRFLTQEFCPTRLGSAPRLMPDMGHVDALLHFAGPGMGLTLATFSFAASRNGEHRAARVLFWLAAAFFSVPALWW
jgi:hypothetical protein